MATKQLTAALKLAEAANVRFVSLQFTDIMGMVKNVHIPFHKFGDAVDHGLWFDGSSIEGFARIHESDMFLDPGPRRPSASSPGSASDGTAAPPRSSATSTRRTASRSPAIRAGSCAARSSAPKTRASAT